MRFASSRVLIALTTGLVLAACTDKTGDTTVTDDTGGGTTSGDCTVDADGDGVCEDEDCDDLDADVYPGATEECDGIDNDCDDEIDEGVTGTYYYDGDGDGFGDASTALEACEALPDYVPTSDDCDDGDADIYPGAEELCDGLDNDCDDIVDNGLSSGTWYADADEDGYGDPDSSITACEEPTGYVDNDYDCDDAAPEEPVHVAGDGSFDWGAKADGSSSDPYATIQEGIDAAEACVVVDADTYNEDINLGGKDISVTGVSCAESTIIYGTGAGPTVTFSTGESAKATLEGFTITGGTGMMTETSDTDTCGSGDTCYIYTTTYMGGGIYINGADPTLADLIITDNTLPPYSMSETGSDISYTYSYGGGVYAEDSSSTFDGVWFMSNYADMGGGLYADSGAALSLTATGFEANGASAGGGVAAAGTVTATNAIFVNNASEETDVSYGGAGLDVTGLAYLTNVSGAGNDGLATLYISASGSSTVMNSVLVQNESGSIIDGESGGSLAITFSDIYNTTGDIYGAFSDSTGTDGNINSDPMFVAWSDDDDYATDDLNLAAGSPGIDAGSPVAAYKDTDGSTNDMGAYGGPGGGW